MINLSGPLISYPVLMILFPVIGLSVNALFFKANPVRGARFSSFMLGLGLTGSLAAMFFYPDHIAATAVWGFKTDGLSLLMSTLILAVSFVVHQYSLRYMAGDRQYRPYFLKLTAISSSAIVMVFADNLALLWLSWSFNNLLLVSLMIHKREWQAARQSGLLAIKTLSLGSLALLLSFLLMYQVTGSSSITYINAQAAGIPLVYLSAILGLLITGAAAQSAQWPCHRWLTSSLNSPGPVSALMHAGFINGGGFILVRFAPLLLNAPLFLHLLFLTGALAAILGTAWKLVQSDIKRMLAHSTLAQMGFMMMQCGLGLFPAAVAHLCWHGLFKASLFLNSGSALKVKKEKAAEYSLTVMLLAFLPGLIGAAVFALITGKSLFTLQAGTFLVGFAFISGTQSACSILASGSARRRMIPALITVSLLALLYGGSIRFVESFFPSYPADMLPGLNTMHLLVFTLFVLLWLGMNFKSSLRLQQSSLWKRLYVSTLNGSQPHPDTISATRNNYQF
ncbi:proton-conducting transporter transmembrane domain-containing protein [Legionella sp. CNM-4043-24]|uniref:proton-conducting transporter transmembrane domain-containing protein n=1 Tax=Legionella sp. CNM-4043-24 TaxID=3421646 RepID=UPI00403B0528